MTRILSFDMGTKNLAWALVECPGNHIKSLGVMDLGSDVARDATESLLDTLAKGGANEWMNEGCDEIVVETQPVNGPCKILSFVLFVHFRSYDMFHQRPARPFRFMPAGFKLKYNPAVVLPPKSTYEERKEAAVQMAFGIFAENPEEQRFIEHFRGQNHKRRTDLADALVQACQHYKAPDTEAKKSRQL